MPEFSLRTATADDEAFLVEMLYAALFVPPGADPFPRSVIESPDLAPYASGFGTAHGDVGVVAELADGTPIGAAWGRLPTPDHPGFGYVDDDTPELSIAVAADHRGRGVGTALLTELLDAAPRMCLSVDNRNPAVRLYERFGFIPVSSGRDGMTMLRPGP